MMMFTEAPIRWNKFNEENSLEHRETAGKVVIKDKTHKVSTHHLRFKEEQILRFSSLYFRFRMVG